MSLCGKRFGQPLCTEYIILFGTAPWARGKLLMRRYANLSGSSYGAMRLLSERWDIGADLLRRPLLLGTRRFPIFGKCLSYDFDSGDDCIYALLPGLLRPRLRPLVNP